jgi:Domain of unknown function (DUF4189)
MIAVKRVAAIGGIAAVGAVSAIVLASPASADGTWSAIAISQSTKVIGWSWGYPIKGGPDSAAAQRAVQECANHPLHPTDCTWLASAKCVALTVSPERYHVGMGSTREEAKNDAQFPGGTYVDSACSASKSLPHGESSIAP